MKYIGFVLLVLAIGVNAWAEEDTVVGKVVSIESRDSGAHAIYLSVAIPAQGCTHSDRAVIAPGTPGADALLSVALTALAAQKDVVLRAGDCTAIKPPLTLTAPRVIRLHIYN